MTRQGFDPASDTARLQLPVAGRSDIARLATQVGLPLLAGGVLARRRKAMAALERVDADHRAVEVLREMRRRYGPGPLLVELPGKHTVAVVLRATDVRRVLADDPEPFNPASYEKRAALAHFQPHGVLVSTGRNRAARREVNERALDMDSPVHRLATPFAEVIHEETAALTVRGLLGWDDFADTWGRIARRIVLGDGARDDEDLTDELRSLRLRGNWAFASPVNKRLRDRFTARLSGHLDRAEPGSLAHALAEVPASGRTDPAGQVPHWLFAFDAAGIAAVRALALLAGHDAARDRALDEVANVDLLAPQQFSYLRACILESVRLWPTTPVILRESTETTRWDGDTLPAGTTFVVLPALFHRDEQAVRHANAFAPETWLDGTAEQHPALVPFSAGPARCPGENMVLFTASTFLANALAGAEFALETPRLDARRPLPATLNHFGITFSVGEGSSACGGRGPSGAPRKAARGRRTRRGPHAGRRRHK